MQTPEQWAINEKIASWTCITGDVGDWTADEQWYHDPGEDSGDTSKHECPKCGWKFRAGDLWGCTFTVVGDTCPNCLVVVTDDDDDYSGCFSPRD